MKVSIIMATFNSEKFITESIEGILRQTYADWELLITDDCSNDKTWDILETFQTKDERIKLYRLNVNSGPGVARNNSISNAEGRYIAFCDSDDIWFPQKLEKQLDFMKERNLNFTFASYQKITESGEKRGVVYAPGKLTYNDLLKTCSIGCLTAIYDSSKLGKVYMPEIRKRQDYGLWLKIFQKIKVSNGMEEVVAYYRERQKSVSSNKFLAAKYHYKVLRETAGVPLLASFYYLFHYIINGILKFIK